MLRALVHRISGDHYYGAIHTKCIAADKFIADTEIEMFKQFCDEVEIDRGSASSKTVLCTENHRVHRLRTFCMGLTETIGDVVRKAGDEEYIS